MVFVPTPGFLLEEELEQGMILVINNDGNPIPEALVQRFSAMGGSAGMVVLKNETFACWRFVDVPSESEYMTTCRCIEHLLRDFKEERGESLCSLQGEPFKWKDFAEYTRWYMKQLRNRENLLDQEEEHFRWSTPYEERLLLRRALYRAANRHPDYRWWGEDYQRKELHLEWAEECKRESTFADVEFDARKKASGLQVGSVVRTCIVPKGARTIRVPAGSIGTITQTTDLYWMVTFFLPLTDDDGVTWLPHDERQTITIGYLTEELSLLSDGDR